MKITDKRKGKKKAFRELSIGDVFFVNSQVEVNEKFPDMRISPCMKIICVGEYKCVNLSTVVVFGVDINDDELVEPLDAELIIRG